MIKIKEEYYKHSRRGKAPMSFHAWQDPKTKKITWAKIKKDPIFKKYPKYEAAIKKHELAEIKFREKGESVRSAHLHANKVEPKLTRGKSVRQLWKEMK